MRIFWFGTVAVVLAGSAALAGGIDRSGQSIGPLFAKGRSLEFSFGSVSPTVSGTSVTALGGRDSGNMAGDYTQASAAYKADINGSLAYALIVDQPFGANVDYPTGTSYYAEGSTATLKSMAVTGLLKYRMPGNFSVFGGPRAQAIKAEISLPAGSYTANGRRDWAWGYVLGIAWEKPEIAARVSLSYNSSIKNQLDTTENAPGPSGPITYNSVTDIKTPRSFNLDFQTGIAKDTLLFGSVRWAAWKGFAISPALYAISPDAHGDPNGPIVSFSNDRTTYSLGLGRRINDSLAVSVIAGYEPSAGGISSNLAPTDGFRSVGLGATYTSGNIQVSGGIRYLWIGDAETKIATPLGTVSPAAHFTGNHATAIGLKVSVALQKG